MLNDSKGQISIELVLVLAFILVIVLAISQYIGPNIEQDNVMSAAKVGVINASNDLAYNGTGSVIKFSGMTLNGTIITVNIFCDKSLDGATKTDMQKYIADKMLSNIANTTGLNRSDNTIVGKYGNYTINFNNIIIG